MIASTLRPKCYTKLVFLLKDLGARIYGAVHGSSKQFCVDCRKDAKISDNEIYELPCAS